MIRFTFKKGLRFLERQRVWTLLRRLATGSFQFEDEQGELVTLTESELMARWMRREWLVDEQSLSNFANVFYLATPRDLASFSDQAQVVAKRRHAYLKEIEAKNVASIDEMVVAAKQMAAEIGDPSPPSKSTLRRWWSMYRHTKCITHLADGRFRSGRPRAKSASIFFEDAVARIYLDPQKHPGLAVYDDMRKQIGLANQNRGFDKIVCPSKATIYRWLLELEQDLVDSARLGKYAAERKYRPVLGQVTVSRILERIEVDHSPLDLHVIDEDTMLLLGRPWITVAIDRYSRAILGFYICFHEPSSFSILQCLKRAILPKEILLAQYPDIKESWPCYGIPELVACDNGMDLHSEAFKEICREMGVQLQFCPAKEPEYKGAIERFFRTVNQGLIHRLPGTVFSNIQQRGNYPSEEIAAIDLKTLTHLLTKWIVEVYHCTPHRKIGGTPLSRWVENKSYRSIELPPSAEQMDVLVGIPATRTLFKYGLELDNLIYNSDELQLILARHGVGKGLKLMLKFYEDDVGYIHVFDPNNKIYLRINAIHQDYVVGLSRHIHRMIVEKIRKENDGHFKSDRLLDAKHEIQAIVSQALLHKKMANRKRGAKLSRLDSEAVTEETYAARKSSALKRSVLKSAPPPDISTGIEDELPAFKTADRIRQRGE